MYHILQIQWRFLPTNRWSSNGRSNFSHVPHTSNSMEISTNKQMEQQWEVQLHCFRNLYAIIRDNSHHNSRHPPKVWERHVDDVFSIVHKAYLQELLEHINSLHPQTQFTKEEENNSSVPFLTGNQCTQTST